MSIRRLLVVILVLAIDYQLGAVSSTLASETGASVPLSGISASFQPDLFTGTLTGSIPIDVRQHPRKWGQILNCAGKNQDFTERIPVQNSQYLLNAHTRMVDMGRCLLSERKKEV